MISKKPTYKFYTLKECNDQKKQIALEYDIPEEKIIFIKNKNNILFANMRIIAACKNCSSRILKKVWMLKTSRKSFCCHQCHVAYQQLETNRLQSSLIRKGQRYSPRTEFKKGQTAREKNGRWIDGRHIYRDIYEGEKKCAICGTTEKTVIHHQDNNHYNNNKDNLQCLCRWHHENLVHKIIRQYFPKKRMDKNVIAITGINSFVGSHLLDLLLKDEKNIIIGMKRINSNLDNIKHNLDNQRLILIDADLNDNFSLNNFIRKYSPEKIYHVAALSLVTPSWDMAELYMETNGCGQIRLLNAIRIRQEEILRAEKHYQKEISPNFRLPHYNPRIEVLVTPEEYGNTQAIINEESPLKPVNPYAASKVAQDMICQVYQKSYNMDIVRTRFFNAIGERRQTLGFTGSVSKQIALIEARKQEPIIKVGNLEAIRNFTDVKDIVRGLVEVMEKGKTGELYLFGSKELYSMKELLEKMISLSTRKDITYEIDPALVRPTELKRFEGCFDKMASISDWKPKIPLEQTINDEINYWRARV